LSGKVLLSKRFHSPLSTLNEVELPDGVYFISLTINDKTDVQKLIIINRQ